MLSTNSEPAGPLGRREPRWRLVPDAPSSSGPEAVGLAAAAGIVCDPWQADTLFGAMGELPGGSWAATEVGLVVPRQDGKNGGIMLPRQLHGAYVRQEPLQLHTAHEFKTCRRHFKLLTDVIEATPALRRQTKRIRRTTGEEGIETVGGSEILFIARSKRSGRGFADVSTIYFDEALILDDDAVGAVVPALAAASEPPQLWYASSAPLLISPVLRRVCKRGRRGPAESLAYFEWCAEDDAATRDVQAWLDANPGIGYRLTLEFTARELEILDEADFRRERLGIWDEDADEAEDPPIDLELWGKRKASAGVVVGQAALACDVTPHRDSVAIAIAGRRPDGRAHLELTDDEPYRRSWTLDRLVELAQRHDPCALVVDGRSAAASLIPALAERGLKPVEDEPDRGKGEIVLELTQRQMASACGALVDGVVDGTVTHYDQKPLNDAVEGVAPRPFGDAWVWSKMDATANIAPLVAVTAAHYGLMMFGDLKPKRKPRVLSGRGGEAIKT